MKKKKYITAHGTEINLYIEQQAGEKSIEQIYEDYLNDVLPEQAVGEMHELIYTDEEFAAYQRAREDADGWNRNEIFEICDVPDNDKLEYCELLEPIIKKYKNGDTDPLDGDDVDALVEMLRTKINVMEGNENEEVIEGDVDNVYIYVPENNIIDESGHHKLSELFCKYKGREKEREFLLSL